MIKTGMKYSAFFILAIIAISLYGFFMIPEGTQIPSHFDIHGNIDDTQPRDFMLIGMPILAIILSAFFMAIPALDPRRHNVEHSQGLLYAGWFGTLTLLTLLHGVIIISTAHNIIPNAQWIIIGVSILLIVVGNFMAKSRSSWFLGLRTPWTLSSENAWTKANRLTGWLMVVTGIISIIVATLYTRNLAAITLIAGIGFAVIAGTAISYFAWRTDDQRTNDKGKHNKHKDDKYKDD